MGVPAAKHFQLRACRLCSCPAFTPVESPGDIKLAREALPKIYPEQFGPPDREAIWRWQYIREGKKPPKLFAKKF